MNGKRARRIRRALSYKKTPDQLVERGGLIERDGQLMFQFARNPYANQYRWWKKGATRGQLPLELVNHLGCRREPHPPTDQDDLSSGEGSE